MPKPAFAPAHLVPFLRAHYPALFRSSSPVPSLSPLPSYDDQKYLLSTASSSYVVRIANTSVPRDRLAFQLAAMDFLASHDVSVPAVIPSVTSDPLTLLDGHLVHVVSFIPGCVLADLAPLEDALLVEFGRFLGTMDLCLAEFEASYEGPKDFVTLWDLSHARTAISDNVEFLDDEEQRALIAQAVAAHERDGPADVHKLRWQVVHNDANEMNVIASPETRGIAGVIDFGDLVYTPLVHNVAIACTYVMLLPSKNNTRTPELVLRGYESVLPLTDEERGLVLPFVRLRLAQSLCLGAKAAQSEPDNEHTQLAVAEKWALLRQLLDTDVDFDDFPDDAESSTSESPLHAAVRAGDEPAVRGLLQRKAKINATNESGLTPLALACSKGNATLVAILLDAGADASIVDAVNATALHKAAQGGSVAAIQLLLKQPTVNPNAVNDDG